MGAGGGSAELTHMARIATAVTAAAVQVTINSEPLGGMAVLHNLDVGREGGCGGEDH